MGAKDTSNVCRKERKKERKRETETNLLSLQSGTGEILNFVPIHAHYVDGFGLGMFRQAGRGGGPWMCLQKAGNLRMRSWVILVHRLQLHTSLDSQRNIINKD